MIAEDEFERFYRDTLPRLESFVARTASSRSLAEDIVQETYFRFLRSAPATLGDEERRRYLYRIAVNLMKNTWSRTRETVEIDDRIAFAEPAVRSELADALERISPRDRAMLWLAYAEGYSHREIAEVLGVGALSVRVLLSRARKRLAKVMERT